MRPLTLLSVLCRAVTTTMKTTTARTERTAADEAGQPADAGEGTVAGVAAVGIANADLSEDDGGDAAGQGDEEAARAEEDEKDGEGAEEYRGEGREVAGLVRSRGKAAMRGAAGGRWMGRRRAGPE